MNDCHPQKYRFEIRSSEEIAEAQDAILSLCANFRRSNLVGELFTAAREHIA